MVGIEALWRRLKPGSWREMQAGREITAISPQLTLLLRTINAQGKQGGIIDFDLARETPATSVDFPNLLVGTENAVRRQARLKYISDFISRLDEIARPQDIKAAMQLDFLKAKLNAHKAFYEEQGRDRDHDRQRDALVRLGYIEATMGLKPEFIGQERLLAQQEIVRGLFEEMGCGNFDRESFMAFRESQRIDPDEARQVLQQKGRLVLDEIGDFIGERIDPPIKPEVVAEDVYWFNWSKGTRTAFVLGLNKHPRHADKFSRAKIQAMSGHEYTHFAQMEGWRKAIDDDELISVLGITSVHDPEQITSEGIAQTIHKFVPGVERVLSYDPDDQGERKPNGAIFELELEGLRQMVYNNVHIMINTQGYSMKDITAYVRRFCPIESASEIKKQMRERTRDDVKKTYLYAYGIGFLRHQWYAMNLNLEGKREILKFIFSQPTTPDQEHALVMTLLNDPHGRYGSMRIPYEEFLGNQAA